MSENKFEKASDKLVKAQEQAVISKTDFVQNPDDKKAQKSYIKALEIVSTVQNELFAVGMQEVAEMKLKSEKAIEENQTKIDKSIETNEAKIDEAIESVSSEEEEESISDVQRRHNDFMQTKRDEAKSEFSKHKYPNRYGIKPAKAVDITKK